MLKRTFSIIFAFMLIFTLFSSSLTASAAFEVTEFDITAKAGLLVSLDTGEFLFERNIDERVYPASITKIMTAIVVLESGKYQADAKIAMTDDVLTRILGTGSVVSNLKAGEEITQQDLMYFLLMSSAGDCAYLAADYYFGGLDAFVAQMNVKAQELGLSGTNYTNPIGLHDDDHYTTVRDIYTLASYAIKNETFKEICGATRYTLAATNMQSQRTLVSTNNLQNPNSPYYYQYAKGIKTGFTDEAGRCLVSTASSGGYNYMCILMGCPSNKANHFTESADLYRWAFNNFSFKEIASSTEPVHEMAVNLSWDTDFVPLYFEKSFVSVLPNAADDSTIVIDIIEPEEGQSIDAPVKKGTVLGKAQVIYAEQVIGTVNLVAGENVESTTILVVVDRVKKFLSSVYMKVLYAAIAVVIVVFIGLCIWLNMAAIKKRKVKYIPYKEREKNRHDR